jgi:hypothetical protein
MYITVPSTCVAELFGVNVTQSSVVSAEQLDIGIQKVSSLGTPTATSVTPRPTEGISGASTCTVKANVTGSEPTYSGEVFGRQGVANVAGYFFDPLPEQRPILGVSTTYGVRLFSTPGSSYTIDVEISWREIG